MKLERLTLKNFGALGERTLEFRSKSTVIYGPNEAGKTTFIDAVTAAMFGAPRGNTVFGKKYLARYGTAAEAAAQLKDEDGTPITAEHDAPLPTDTGFPPELFKTLLAIRAADAHIAHEERNFMESFTSRVLGGGKVNLSHGMNEVRKIYAPNRNYRWYSMLTEAQDTLNMLRTKIYKTGDIETSVRTKNELAALIAEHTAEREKLAARKAELENERALAVLDGFKKLQSELLTIERDIENLSGINRNTFEYYRGLSEEVNTLLASKHAHAARLAEIEKNLAAQQNSKSALEAIAAGFPALELRDRANMALEDCRRKQLLADNQGGPDSGLTRIAAAAAVAVAVAAIAVAIAFKLPWYTAWAAGLVLGTGAYFAARRLAGLTSRAAKARAELALAREACRKALAALGEGWSGEDMAALTEKFERAEHENQRTSGKLETVRALISDHERRLAEEKAALAATFATYTQFHDKLQKELAALGVTGVEALNGKVEKLEYLFCSRDDLARRIVREAGITDKNIKPALELKIQEQQRAAVPLPDGALPRTVREIEIDLKRADKELQSITAQIEQDHRNMNENSDKLARLEGELGMPTAEVFVRERRLENEIDDITRWRDAAESAYQLLNEISKANDDMIRNCVENAAPVFSALTGGRYTGLELRGNNPFEENGITVLHGELGSRPVEWLSSGTQDLLWLSIRLIFAASGYTRPSFMILDEPFLALDRKRTENAFRALAEGPLANWQFIILTKDPATTALAQENGFARIELQPASATELR